jgi:flagellar basal-body rod modification protein FlgD
MALAPVGTIGGPAAGQGSGTATQATDAFGLSFENLLKIVLTQLTYQDPLKPMDNFQFVSQLAQFSQIQQSQAMVDSLAVLVSAQATGQAAGLLGKTVDIAIGAGAVSGEVVAVTFSSGNPAITIETADGSTISSLPLGSVSQIREAN